MYLKVKKIVAILLAGILMYAATSCSGDDTKQNIDGSDVSDAVLDEVESVGISMPRPIGRWKIDGETMKEILEGRGYKVDLQYANDDIPTQQAQIKDMIEDGVDVLIIAAVDSLTLVPTLERAHKEGIRIIAYDRLLDANYDEGEVLDGVLSPSDGVSRGVVAALKSFGYEAGNGFPIVTGKDADAENVKMIIDGEQYSTILKDSRDLAAVVADMVDAILAGTEPEINDTETYDNNVKIVPAYLLEPYIVTKDNYRELLIDSGYLDPEDIK